MKIRITKRKALKKYQYIADPIDIPGSPSVGFGSTCKEALGDLMYFYHKTLGIELELPESELKRIAEEAERRR